MKGKEKGKFGGREKQGGGSVTRMGGGKEEGGEEGGSGNMVHWGGFNLTTTGSPDGYIN